MMIVAILRKTQICEILTIQTTSSDVADEVRYRGDNVAADRDWLMTLVCLQV
jgi:hypothetical protein